MLFVSLIAKAQDSISVTINEKLENTRTSRHVNVRGTRLYLIPPIGFTYSSKRSGFTNDVSSSIVAYDTIIENYFENNITNIVSRIEKRGDKILDKKSVTVQGYIGMFMTLQISRKTQMHVLLFGGKKTYTQIYMPFSSCCKQYADELLQSLNTIWYDKQTVLHPLDTAGFILQDKFSIYQYFGYDTNLNQYSYTINGKADSMDGSLPFVAISRQPTVSENNLATTAFELEKKMVSKYQMVNAVKKNFVSSKINGAALYQFETYGQINGVEALWHCCIITDGNQTFVFEGFSKTDLENSLTEFKKLAATFRIQ
jgi:hypothetical protein